LARHTTDKGHPQSAAYNANVVLASPAYWIKETAVVGFKYAVKTIKKA